MNDVCTIIGAFDSSQDVYTSAVGVLYSRFILKKVQNGLSKFWVNQHFCGVEFDVKMLFENKIDLGKLLSRLIRHKIND